MTGLAETVTGSGKTIAIDSIQGTYTATGKEVIGGVNTDVSYTVSYTESRITKKWYALTEGAVTAYIASNPTATMSSNLVDERTGAWELIVETGTGRVITGATYAPLGAPEE